MKFIFFITLLTTLFFCTQNTKAQNYSTAIGLHLGYPSGITYKQFVSEKTAFDVLLGSNLKNSFSLSGFFEIHNEVIVPELNVFYGGGAHLQMYNQEVILSGGTKRTENKVALGLGGIVGLEYTFERTPFSFAFDAQPTLIFRDGLYYTTQGGLALRYVIR